MSQSADVPIPPDLSRRYSTTASRRDWLASLPRLVRSGLDRWQLALDLEPGVCPGTDTGPLRCRSGAWTPTAGRRNWPC